jgi:hypothetical protein
MLPDQNRGRWRDHADSKGNQTKVWEPSIMTRILDEFLECVFYLYPSRDDAENGAALGGTGFFLTIPWESDSQRRHLYAVTNKHNIAICRDRVVIRATKATGKVYFNETDDVQWFPSLTDDISVLPIAPALAGLFQNVPSALCVDRESFDEGTDSRTPLGPGDKVFMVGRFIENDGKTKNHPSVRFGNISMTAASVRHPAGYSQESIAVEMRSISGYSGSPVFTYWEFGGGNLAGVNRPLTQSFLALLGVDWGHLPLKLPLLQADGKPHPDKLHVKSHTAMSYVVPAWRLLEFLNQTRFKEQRMNDENEETARLAKENIAVTDAATGDDASPHSNDANPKHLEDFTRLVGAAARKPAQED